MRDRRIFQLAAAGALALAAIVYSATKPHAQTITGPVATSAGGCAYNLAPPTLADGTFGLVQCDNAGQMKVTAAVSASISGFRPTVFGTPLAVSNVSGTATLPAGTQVVATNVGTTNGAYCALGATATTSSQYIAPNGGWFAFFISGDTQLSCITAASTTTINIAGGSGLPTGTGGGGGSGAVTATIADGANVVEGAIADASVAAGATGSISAKLRRISTDIAGATPAGTAIIGKVGIDQTTPGTTNGIQLTAGTALAGKVGIDQTTPGTTNGVQLTAGTALAGKVGIDQTTPGTTNGVQLNASTAVIGHVINDAGSAVMGHVIADASSAVIGHVIADSGSTTAVTANVLPVAIAPVVSASAEANHVLKGSAGSIISLTVSSGASAGYVLIFDATSAPVDGAVTPKYCWQLPANSPLSASWPVPASFATGITASFSTTGCFTKTASATAFISGQTQ